MVQWLRLHAPNAGGPGSAPGQETRSDKAQLKIPSGATKTQSSQINQSVKQTTLPCPPAPQGPRQGPSCPLHDHSVCCERLLLGTALQPWVHQPPSPARVLAGVSGARGASGKGGVGSRWWGSGRPGGWGPSLCPEVGGSSSGLREGLQGPPSRSRNHLDSFPQDVIRNVSSKHNDNHTVCVPGAKLLGLFGTFFFFFLISKAIGFCLGAMESGHQGWNCGTNIY